GLETFLQIVGLEQGVVGGGTSREPGIGIRGGDDPTLPQAGAEIVGGGTRGTRRGGLPGLGRLGIEARLLDFGQLVGGRGGEERIAAGKESIILLVTTAAAGQPFALVGLADGAPDHHAIRHFGGDYLGVHGAGANQRGGAEGEIGELLVDLSAVLTVKVLPYEIARLRDIGHILGMALWVGKIFGADGKILGVIIAPVEAGDIAEPLVFAAAPQLSVGGAELVHGDLIGLSVAHEPLIGIETVVTGAKLPDHLIDGAAVLNGHAGAESDRRAFGVERRLADGGFGEHDSSVVLIPIGAALDAARVTLH